MAVRHSGEYTDRLIRESVPLLTDSGRQIFQDRVNEGWKIMVVNQVRGRCYYQRRWITVPLWTFTNSKYCEGYRSWYLGHELSHSIAGGAAKHGPVFMAALKTIVRPEWIHYEHGYKPRNARSAGVPLADGTIPVPASQLPRKSMHPQNVIDSKNAYLRATLGVSMEYVRGRRIWACVTADTRSVINWLSSDQFAAFDHDGLKAWAELAMEAKLKRYQ